MTVAFFTYDEIDEVLKLSVKQETKRNLDLGTYASMLAMESMCTDVYQMLQLISRRQKFFDVQSLEYDIQSEFEKEIRKLREKKPLCITTAKMYKCDRLTDEEMQYLESLS